MGCLILTDRTMANAVLKTLSLLALPTLLFGTNAAQAATMPSGFGACEGDDCPTEYQALGNCGSTNGSDSAFSVFIGGDFLTQAAELEGLGLIGGDATIQTSYDIGWAGVGSCTTAPNDGTDPPDVQVHFGGSITYLDYTSWGANYTGKLNVPVGGSFSENGEGICGLNDYITDVMSNFSTFSSCSASLDPATEDGVHEGILTVESWGNVILDCAASIKVEGICPAGSYLFEHDGDLFRTGWDGYPSNYSLDATAFPTDGSATLIMNMTKTGEVTVAVQTLISSIPIEKISRYMLWNFPNATQVNLGGKSQFDGFFLAPKANVKVNTSTNGRFVAGGNVEHVKLWDADDTNPNGAEFHNYDFIGTLPDSCPIPDAGPLPAPCDGGTTPATEVDLTLTKTTNVTNVRRNDEVIYTITVTNESDTNATGVKVNDLLPTGASYSSDDSSTTSTTYDDSAGVWDIGDITAGDDITLNITVTVD